MGDKRKHKQSKGKLSIKVSNKSSSRRIRSSKTSSPTTFPPSNYNETTSTPTSPPLIPTTDSNKPLPLVPSLDPHSHSEPEISSEYLSSRSYPEYPQLIDHEKEKLELSKLFELEEVKSGRGRQGRNRDVKLLWCSSLDDNTLKNLNEWSQNTWRRKVPNYEFGKEGEESEKEGKNWSKALERLRL